MNQTREENAKDMAEEEELNPQFNDSIDDATHGVITSFSWMGLPEGDQLSYLMVEINDAIAAIMQKWK
jgi:hypothetical protein